MAFGQILDSLPYRALYKWLARIFLCAFLVSGFIFIFALPPGFAPDEETHFAAAVLRIESLLGGGDSACLPFSLDEAFGIARQANGSQDSLPRKSFEYASTRDLSPRCLPKSFKNSVYGHTFTYPGVLFGRISVSDPLHKRKFLAYFYLSRVGQLLFMFFVLLRFTYLSESAPSATPGVLLILGVGVTPIFVQQSMAISADLVGNAYSITVASALLFRHQLKSVDVWTYAVLGLLAVFTKPVFLPICLAMAWLISERDLEASQRFRSKRNQIAALSVACAVCCGVAYLVQISRNSLRPLGPADPAAQLSYVVGHLLETSVLFYNSMNHFISVDSWFQPMGYMNAPNSAAGKTAWSEMYDIVMTLEGLTIASLFYGRLTNGLRLKPHFPALSADLIAIGIGYFGFGIATVLTLYLYWNPVGSQELVAGIQPRYFYAVVFFGVSAAASLLGRKNPAEQASGGFWQRGFIFLFSSYILSRTVFIATMSGLALLTYYY